ncbi:MAG: PD-(D/E)XK nuclease domain-containing protein, partial [Boseongicola sp.]|nr:PD-(D/E)XK nuclease domain-containing protein [Boseongicola sp.]
PNMEVRLSLNQGLLRHASTDRRGLEAADLGEDLCRLLADNDFDGFADGLRALFAGVPYQWHDSGRLGRYEAWYAGMLYAVFQSIGVDARAEEASSHGRADLVLRHDGQVFVMEFKIARESEAAEAAMDRAMVQMRERGYGEKHLNRGAPVHLLGVVFGRRERNLLAVRAEPA